MENDITPQTVTETDAVVERIFTEWDKWVEDPRDERKIEMAELQNKLRELYDRYQDDKERYASDSMELAELREQMTVVDKKMRAIRNNLLQTIWKK